MKQQKTLAGDKHRRNTGNLRPPWKSGQSGNPGGRPPNSVCLTSLLREEMEQPVPKGLLRKLYLREGATWRDAAVRSLLLQSANGNTTAIKELLVRLDGRVPYPVIGADGMPPPAIITVVYDDDGSGLGTGGGPVHNILPIGDNGKEKK